MIGDNCAPCDEKTRTVDDLCIKLLGSRINRYLSPVWVLLSFTSTYRSPFSLSLSIVMQSFVLLALALLVFNASAAVTGSHVSLMRRQAVPSVAGCSTQCSSLGTTETSCNQSNPDDPLACTCSSSFASSLESCYSCAISAGALDATTAQTALTRQDNYLLLPSKASQVRAPKEDTPSVHHLLCVRLGHLSREGLVLIFLHQQVSGDSASSASGASSATGSAPTQGGGKSGAIAMGASFGILMSAALTGVAGLMLVV
ncbi:hypothetical protein K439DRAFT_1663880 [Ramaria rubella]|nr:hypothetical protein K439DRAFT_1663880 [Ramaria rubella]